MQDIIGITAGVVGVAGYAPYVRDILGRSTQPDRVSWLIWAAEYAVLCLAQIAKGAGPSIWLTGLQFAGVVVVFALSLKFGVGKLDRSKAILLACVGLALFAWGLIDDPAVAIVILVLVEASGAALTTLKAYRSPDSETLSMWLCISLGGTIGLFAVPSNAAAILYLYPAFLIVMGVAIITASRLGARRAGTPSYQPEA